MPFRRVVGSGPRRELCESRQRDDHTNEEGDGCTNADEHGGRSGRVRVWYGRGLALTPPAHKRVDREPPQGKQYQDQGQQYQDLDNHRLLKHRHDRSGYGTVQVQAVDCLAPNPGGTPTTRPTVRRTFACTYLGLRQPLSTSALQIGFDLVVAATLE